MYIGILCSLKKALENGDFQIFHFFDFNKILWEKWNERKMKVAALRLPVI